MRFYRGVYFLWASTPELSHSRTAYVYEYKKHTWRVVRESRIIEWENYTLHFDDLTYKEQEIVLSWPTFIEYQLN